MFFSDFTHLVILVGPKTWTPNFIITFPGEEVVQNVGFVQMNGMQ